MLYSGLADLKHAQALAVLQLMRT
jgi:hypothetical protein